MPTLVEWLVHYPADWTPAQARSYASYVLAQLSHGMIPCLQALGPSHTSGVLLALITIIAQRNPLSARDICGMLANAYDAIEQLDPLKGVSVQ